jgi:hypothetical protein
MSLDVQFGRSLLNRIVPDVRRHVPGVRMGDAWVYRYGRDQWEFHYRDFYWHGRAASAYEARYRGWAALLEKLGAEGWKRDGRE